MTPTAVLVRDNLSPTILRYAEVSERTLVGSVKRAAKGVTRRVIAITPPASQGITGASAKRAGQVRIASQMNAVLAPVRLKGRRAITTVFGHRLKRPVYVPTREKYPDVAALYRSQTRTLRDGVGIRLKDYRPGQKKFVDVRKFRSVLQAKQGAVGKLASGFAAGAQALDVPVQQWIGRHGPARGSVVLDLAGPKLRITVRNTAPGLPAHLAAEMDRRIAYAIQYQGSAMQREIDYLMFKNARDLAIKTRNFAPMVPAGMAGADPSV